jgi:hypothetical protein
MSSMIMNQIYQYIQSCNKSGMYLKRLNPVRNNPVEVTMQGKQRKEREKWLLKSCPVYNGTNDW